MIKTNILKYNLNLKTDWKVKIRFEKKIELKIVQHPPNMSIGL